jgi:ABC-type polysaccharide/polyol phosphate transport system ATPase subunit
MSSDAQGASRPVLIHARDVSKYYPSHLGRLRLLRYLWPMPMAPKPDDFWALQSMSLDVHAGEVVGLIGRNGSGKSTFLQIVAGLLEPSGGSVRVQGVSAALLELGAGFNPEFTGRENIFLSGAVYGHSREKMLERFDKIVDFADIGPHLDQPVKTYSSGMFARLAFAVAIEVEPDVILIDEILSVGDAAFVAKCFQRIETLRNQGTAIIFVSHDLNSVQSLCDRAVLLDGGHVVREGVPKEVTDAYLHLLSTQTRRAGNGRRDVAPGESVLRAEIRDAHFYDAEGRDVTHPRAGEPYRVSYRVVFHEDVETPIVTLQLKTLVGLVLLDHTNLFSGQVIGPCRRGDELLVSFDLDLNLCPGPYRVGFSVASMEGGMPVSLFGSEAMTIEVISHKRACGFVYADTKVEITKTDVRKE